MLVEASLRVGSAAACPTDPTSGPLAGCGSTLRRQQPPDLRPHTRSSRDLLRAVLPRGAGRRFWGRERYPGGVGEVRRRGPGALSRRSHARPACLPPPGLPLLASALQAAPVLPSRALYAPAAAACLEPEHEGWTLKEEDGGARARGWGCVTSVGAGRMAFLGKMRLEGYMSEA